MALVLLALAGGFVSYLQFRASDASAKSAQAAVRIARDTLNAGNDSFTKTLNEMKAQSTASETTAKAAQRSADIGQKALSASIANSRLDQRPWIDLGEYRLSSEPEEGRAVAAAFVILNSGKSPAFNEVAQSILRAWTSPPDFTVFSAPSTQRSASVVPPGETHVRSSTGPFTLDKNWVGLYKAKRASLYLHVMVTYTDAFGTPHWTKVCMYHCLGMVLDSFAYCPSDNEMDHN